MICNIGLQFITLVLFSLLVLPAQRTSIVVTPSNYLVMVGHEQYICIWNLPLSLLARRMLQADGELLLIRAPFRPSSSALIDCPYAFGCLIHVVCGVARVVSGWFAAYRRPAIDLTC